MKQRVAARAWAGLLLIGAAAACRRDTAPPGPPLRPPAPAAAERLRDGEGVLHAGRRVVSRGTFDWELPEDAAGQLRLAWSSPEKAGAVALIVEEVAEGAAPREIARVRREFPRERAKALVSYESLPVRVGGTRRRLRLRAEPAAPLFLSDLRIVRPSDAAPAAVVLLFDTTRRDAVGFGGCPDPSTPNLDAILRDAWKADRAYAAASWTIPSVASILTGRVPAAHEDADGSPLGIESGAVTLAEDFRSAGWSTAAFLANPTLREENGFAAGFQTFFVTPYDGASIVLPGRETMKHVPAWLAAHRGEPFLLLINLLDPHDPYQPFDRPPGRTPFDPNYAGPIVGDEVNRLQLGEMATPPPAGVRHLAALYHDEVRLADEEVGKLWNSTPATERARWTVVFTADHGEEFGEHRGWKHGPALYDETLRVPLAIRAGGRQKASLPRPDSLVSLLDLLPTLEAVSGLPRPRRLLDGRSLLDGAGRREVLPAVTMLTGGAPRAAVVRRDRKLFFFDRLGARGIPDPVKDPDGHRLALRLREILPGLGTFDLARDPGEKNLLPIDRASFPDDWRSIEKALAHTRRGLELRAVAPGAAGPLEVAVEGFGPEASVEPFAFEEDDRFSWRREGGGMKLSARLDLSDGIDGLKFDGGTTGNLRITVGGTPAPCVLLLLEGARPVPLEAGNARAVPLAAIPEAIPRFEAPGGCAGVFLWKAAGRAPARSSAEEEEAWKKLRALGYLH